MLHTDNAQPPYPRPLRLVAATDSGRRRKTNQDRFLIDTESGVVVLADGMGGHRAGELAAQGREVEAQLERADAVACRDDVGEGQSNQSVIDIVAGAFDAVVIVERIDPLGGATLFHQCFEFGTLPRNRSKTGNTAETIRAT